MKNLKRVLTVVLAVAMMFSIVAVASATTIEGDYAETIGKKTYGDYEDIVNKDAVDLLTNLTVLDGFEDGNYHPEKNLTRAQMAKIIAYVKAQPLLSPTLTLDKFLAANASNCDFADVAADHWARGAIGYDKYTGIVDGVDGVNFNPERNVKKVEAAKMCLVVLGYDAEVEGLVGPDWIGNTLNLALVSGILDGIDIEDPEEFITRDEMALMVENMLMANMVGYVEVDGDLHAIFDLQQLNDLGHKYIWYNNGDLLVGHKGIEYYFGKEAEVVTGIVIANGFTAFGLDDDEEAFDYEYEGTFAGHSYEYYPEYETVIYVPGSECIGTGYCIGEHNWFNTNCPANFGEIIVVPVYSCYEEIGREVKLSRVGNILTGDIDDFTSMVVTANNAAEVVNVNGAVNDAAEIKLADTTLVSGIFFCEEQGGHYGELPYLDVDDTFTETYALAAVNDIKAPNYKVWAANNPEGYVHYNIDNNGDGVADFSIAIEEMLATPQNGVAGLLLDWVDDGLEIIHGEAPEGGVSLCFNGIAINSEISNKLERDVPKCLINDNLEKKIGTVDDWTGNYLAGDFVFNKVTFDGTTYPISLLCTREFWGDFWPLASKLQIGNELIFYLDHDGNVVKLENIQPKAPVEALVYGIERSTHVYSDYEAEVYTIYTINKDGEKATYDLAPNVQFISDTAPLADVINDNTAAVYCKLTFDKNDYVVAIKDLETFKNQDYVKGLLVIGDIADEYATIVSVLDANMVLWTDFEDVNCFVNDDTVFFNFQRGFGKFGLDWSDSLVNAANNYMQQTGAIGVGDVTVSKVDKIADTTLGSTWLGMPTDPWSVSGVAYTDPVLEIPYAEVVTLPITQEYKPIGPIKALGVDQMGAINNEYVFITMDDMSMKAKVTCEPIDANGGQAYMWTIPCEGDRSEVKLLDWSQLYVAFQVNPAQGGILVRVWNEPGYNYDFIEVVDLSGEGFGVVKGTVMSNSNLIERLAILVGDEDDNTPIKPWIDNGGEQERPQKAVALREAGVIHAAYPDGCKIFRIADGEMTEISGKDIKAGETIVFYPSVINGQYAAGFACSISVAFVGDVNGMAPNGFGGLGGQIYFPQ